MAIDTIRLFGADAAEDGEAVVHIGLSGAQLTMDDSTIPGLNEQVTLTITSVGRKTTQESGKPYRIGVAAGVVKIK